MTIINDCLGLHSTFVQLGHLDDIIVCQTIVVGRNVFDILPQLLESNLPWCVLSAAGSDVQKALGTLLTNTSRNSSCKIYMVTVATVATISFQLWEPGRIFDLGEN